MRIAVRRADVVAIVILMAFLLAIGVPYLQRSREAERRTRCAFRMGKVARAALGFEDEQNRFPGYRERSPEGAGASRATSWVGMVLPFLAQVATVDSTPTNRASKYLATLTCPSDVKTTRQTLTAALSYVANCGMPDGVASATAPADWPANGVCMDLFNVGELGGSKYVTLSYVAAHDGSGETLLLSENVDAGFWTDSRESSVGFVWSTGRTHRNGGRVSAEARILRINQQTGAGDASIRFSRPSSFHPTGVNVAYCDGRVAFLSECIDYVMFARMMTPDGAGIKYPGTDTPIGPPYRECP